MYGIYTIHNEDYCVPNKAVRFEVMGSAHEYGGLVIGALLWYIYHSRASTNSQLYVIPLRKHLKPKTRQEMVYIPSPAFFEAPQLPVNPMLGYNCRQIQNVAH
jgi:hypothetical protein